MSDLSCEVDICSDDEEYQRPEANLISESASKRGGDFLTNEKLQEKI